MALILCERNVLSPSRLYLDRGNDGQLVLVFRSATVPRWTVFHWRRQELRRILCLPFLRRREVCVDRWVERLYQLRRREVQGSGWSQHGVRQLRRREVPGDSRSLDVFRLLVCCWQIWPSWIYFLCSCDMYVMPRWQVPGNCRC